MIDSAQKGQIENKLFFGLPISLKPGTLQKKEVFGQLNPLEKCFKICYIYGKRNLYNFFRFLFQATLIFPL